MTYPTLGQDESIDRVATRILVNLGVAVGKLRDLRAAAVQYGAFDSLVAQDTYQSLIQARNYHVANQNRAGLADAYRRLIPSLTPDFDPAFAWDACETPVMTFLANVRAGWPHLTQDGRPAFYKVDPVTYELVSFQVTLSSDLMAALIADMDQVLACFSA